MAQKAIIELRDVKPRQQGDYQVRAAVRPELKVSAHKKAQELLERRAITTRDINIARALIGVGLLTRHQLQRLFFADHPVVASNRLVKLYRHYFLERGHYWLLEMAAMGLEPCYIYTLGNVGQEIFAVYNGLRRQDVPFTSGRYSLMRSNHFLLHDLQISEMFTRLQVAATGVDKRLIWYNEMAAALYHGEDELVRPDGLASLYDDTWRANFFIEMDRGNTDWGKKLEFYDRARRQSSWRQQLMLSQYPDVLCVVPPGRAMGLVQLIQAKKPETRFLVKEWDAFVTEDALDGWLDVGPQRPVQLLPE
ncbi:MAG: replication-relaxation family protein [Chloroflexi bacterium]|nr:replication-relaxation family protein [Chloroflexota bacterium]